LGPTASISVMTAPQPEATTTPVSSSRAGVQLPVPWARPKTRKVDRSAPAKAEPESMKAPAPASMAASAPTEAPPETPRT